MENQAKSDSSQFFDSLTELNKKLQEEIYRGKSQYEETIINFHEEIASYQIGKKRLEEENSRLKDELNHTKEEANIIEAKLRELLKENKEWKIDVSILSKKKLALEEALDRTRDEYKSFEKASKIAVEQYTTARKNNEAMIEELQKLKSKAEKEASERQHVIERKDRDLWQHNQQIQQMQSLMECHISTINSLDKDKKDLTLRLSKLAGPNLTYNNPNIADLSDENRPTKIAEEFSELYDNEWTDAFEMVEMESEPDKAQFMLHILKIANQLCYDATRNHMDAIKSSLSTLVLRDLWTKEQEEKPEENVYGATASIHGEKTNTEKEVGQQDKHFSCSESDKGNDKPVTITKDSCISGNQTSLKTNEADTVDRKARDHTVWNAGGTKQNAEGNSNDNTVKENWSNGINTDNPPKEDNSKYQTERKIVKMTGRSKPDTKRDARNEAPDSDAYKIGKDLRTDGERSTTSGNEMIKTSDTNDNTFKHSQNGKKALYPLTVSADFEKLASEHKKKVLEIRYYFENQLSKEFQKVGSSIIEKEIGLDQHENARESIVKYIEKCMTLCWSMCRNEPPVHIKFLETEGEQLYDTNMFKPYTMTGKHLDFVIWPALYLYKNGPMLAKGVAQGRK